MPASPRSAEVLRQRKKLCLEIAEEMIDTIVYKNERDVDKLAMLVETSLPLGIDEAIAEYEEFTSEEETRPIGPTRSVLDRLTEALGLAGEKLSIVCLLKAACERLEKKPRQRKKLRTMLHDAFMEGFQASGEGWNGEYGCSVGDPELEKRCREAIDEIDK